MTGKVLVIGDDRRGEDEASVLRAAGLEVTSVEGEDRGAGWTDPDGIDLVLLMSGNGQVAASVSRIKARFRSTPVVLCLNAPTAGTVVEAFRGRAWDVLLEPVDPEALTALAARAVDVRAKGRERRDTADQLERERARVEDLKRRFGADDPFVRLVGLSQKMRTLVDGLREIARSDSNMLITGESGTGKGLVARAIHDASERHDGPFVPANCVVYSEGLLHSELFGHERGAFTGADRLKKGRFELASGGTIFLDEIGEISPATQLLLLRVLQERTFERAGGEVTLSTDARVLAATNGDLEAMIRQGRFRRDLYYRLNVIPVHLPPLRERAEDIPVLATTFLRRLADKNGTRVEEFSREALELLAAYPWPGNVRELENVVERLYTLARGRSIGAADLPYQFHGRGTPSESAARTLTGMEAARIVQALEDSGGNKKRAARMLGIHRATLYVKLRKYGLHDAPALAGAGTDVDLPEKARRS